MRGPQNCPMTRLKKINSWCTVFPDIHIPSFKTIGVIVPDISPFDGQGPRPLT